MPGTMKTTTVLTAMTKKCLLFVLGLACLHASVYAQLLQLNNPANDEIVLADATFGQLASVEWDPAQSTETTASFTLKSNFDESVTVCALIKYTYRDQAFYTNGTSIGDGNDCFTIGANGTQTVQLTFRPLHNIAYDAEVLFYEQEGRATLTVDVQGTGLYDETRVRPLASVSIDPNNGQTDIEYDLSRWYYEGTNNLSEFALLQRLRQITQSNDNSGDNAIVRTWANTNRRVYLMVDSWYSNPFPEFPIRPPRTPGTPAPEARGTNQQYGVYVCQYTGIVGTTRRGDRLVRRNAASNNVGVPADDLGVPTYFGDPCANSPLYNGFAVEHTVPASHITGFGTDSRDARSFFRYHDLHHLFPISSSVNSAGHSNYAYGEIGNPGTGGNINASYPAAPLPALGPAGTEWQSFRIRGGTADSILADPNRFRFEPSNNAKGYVARAHLYMVTRYGDRVVPNNVDRGWRSAFYGDVGWFEVNRRLMRDWHDRRPVTERELRRNNAVQVLQWNRNPYVDYPQFAWRITDMSYVPMQHTDEPGLQRVADLKR